MEGPLLWFLNRGTGVVALVLLTVATVLGVLALGGRPGSRVPRFVVQAVHRNVALLAVVTVVVHVLTGVVDEFVDIRWWQAFLPWSLRYQPLWLALGIVARDVLLVSAFPFVDKKGIARIPVSFAGKSATAALLAGLTLMAYSETTFPGADYPYEVGFALVVAGAILYWITAVLYAREAFGRLGELKRDPLP